MRFIFGAKPPAAVQEQTDRNKAWGARLRVVLLMEAWLRDNLRPDEAGCAEQIREHLHAHLILGKALHPTDTRDPLFTFMPFENRALKEALRYEHRYVEFCAELQRQCEMSKDMGPAPEPTWEQAHALVSSAKGMERLRELKEGLERQRLSMELIEQVIIGLVLRYACVGGFEGSVLHACVRESWGEAFDGFVDCFASPMNHRFKEYYSLFEEDAIYFGSKGNFFAAGVKKIPAGCYHMHPPFIDGVFEALLKVLRASIGPDRPTTKVLLVTPKWDHTTYSKPLDRLVVDQVDAAFKLELPRMSFVHTNGFCLTEQAMVYIFGAFPSRSKLVHFFYLP